MDCGEQSLKRAESAAGVRRRCNLLKAAFGRKEGSVLEHKSFALAVTHPLICASHSSVIKLSLDIVRHPITHLGGSQIIGITGNTCYKELVLMRSLDMKRGQH